MDKYYLGLDIGTNSVGWAVTDRDYVIKRAKGKDLWGVREFDEANTAIDRRIKRTSRRRLQREKVRQAIVKSYFADEIDKVDPSFYTRLDNSFYKLEDKVEIVRNKNGLFNDENYSDKDYFRDYPTIFHLRKNLIYSNDSHDVRLVYLAVINMFKHRGHFLNASMGTEVINIDRGELLSSYFTCINDICGISFNSNVKPDAVFEILGSKAYGRSHKKEELASIYGINLKDKQHMVYINLLCGLSVKVVDLFPDLGLEDNKISISFSEASYEDKVSELMEKIGGENYSLVECAKKIYDEGVVSGIMGQFKYLSEARVDEYEKHGKDLKILKKVIKRYFPKDIYNHMFRSEDVGTYGSYVKSVCVNGDVSRRHSSSQMRKREELYKKVTSYISAFEDDADVKYILEEIERETFLPKQLTSANGAIPNQIHVVELKRILENASEYLAFLNDIDESGLSVKERILRLFSFQIPYYIGPTSARSAESGGNGWVIRREEGMVLPWNLETKIDVDATHVEFIRRLVRDCTYLEGHKVLPKCSLLYEKYCVLNEINNIKIDGDAISVDLKQDIYRDLFEKGKKVSRKNLEKYLINIKKVINDGSQLSGIDITINNSLSSYGKFVNVLGDKLQSDDCRNMVEDIIFISTVYGDSKAYVRNRIKEKYSKMLDDDQIKRIIGFKFKDWGRLSKEFLEMSGCDKGTGETLSLISALWNTNMNMMELLYSEQYSFGDVLNERKNKAVQTLGEFSYEDLGDMYFSAPVKRMVWQTVLVIKEIESVLGCSPERVFIEMTRGDGEKQRTKSRKDELLELLKAEGKEWKELIKKSDESGILKSKKLYLYIKQLGRCMYTGEQIDLDNLFDDNMYDIDHIYPRSKVKDDSIDNNLVLVKKQINAAKTDSYPVNDHIYQCMKDFWKILWLKNLISDEKYKRLMCRKPFTEEQLASFISRQLVETSQGTKGVAELLEYLLQGKTEVVFSKAKNVSDFRRDNGFVKSRLVNEFHHAQDAYLNIVVGNTYFVKFTKNPLNYIRNDYMSGNSKYNINKMFDWDVVRGDDVAWRSKCKNGNRASIDIVREMMHKTTPLLTRLSYTGHGAISNETLYSASVAKKDNYIPISTSNERLSNVEKYGGFTSLNPAYFIFIEHGKQGKRKRCFDVVPIYYAKNIENKGDLKHYCEDVLGYEKVSIICEKIKKNALFKLNGYYLYISGVDGRKQVEFFNATQLIVGDMYVNYIHEIEVSRNKGVVSDKISKEKNIELYGELMRKHSSNILIKSPKPLFDILCSGERRFEALELEIQMDILYRLVLLTSICRKSVGLKEIGGPASDNGRIRISGNMTGCNELKLINMSVTGIYSQAIDLMRNEI